MGVRGNTSAGSSGLGTDMEAKYRATYNTNSTATTYQYRILGDATAEFWPFGDAKYGSKTRQISSWYKDEGWFVNSYYPWFARGGWYDIGLGAGVFVFNLSTGAASRNYSFRIVLAI